MTGVLEPFDVTTASVDAAEAAALAGELVAAARHADAVVGAGAGRSEAPGPERARAATVLATVLAHRGMLARTADLHRWADAVHPGSVSPASAIALVGTGSLDAVTPAADPAVPTLRAAADTLIGRGVRAAAQAGGSAVALADLTRASATLECHGLPVVADDSPAALAALVALRRGEADLARTVLDRAVACDLGGPAFRRRHLLLRSWAGMAAGDPAVARAGLAEIAAVPGPVGARDDLVAVALEAGLARRAGDLRTLLAAWGRAREVVLRHAVDLWSLEAIGELLVAAARLREAGWLAPHVADAEHLLDRLGHPALWAAPWYWQSFLAAVLVEDEPAAMRQAARLRAAACRGQDDGGGEALAPVLAEAAARWLEVLHGDVDTDAVTAVATALRDVGMASDGARLAKEAAARSTERRTLSTMLGVARAVLPTGTARRPEAVEPEPDGPPGAVETSTDTDDDGERTVPGHLLSEREREVAALLLEGMTHRQIGERLFISSKTVEHHVGRIRQRLNVGSSSRTELFADLRSALGTS